ncbi:hypothetical protein SUGI_0555480 [Cryptomeria japonica]|nr:hypothetical protein SUGI_0555480 [Cryptomeria japonica]
MHFIALVIVGDCNNHVDLGIKCSKEVATVICGVLILASLDFTHESGGDLQQPLRRCVVLPLYVRAKEGKRFVAFMFALNAQLAEELLPIICTLDRESGVFQRNLCPVFAVSSLSSPATRNGNKKNVNVILVDLEVNDSLQTDVRRFSESDMRRCKENEKVQDLLDVTSPSLEIETAGV